MGESMSDMGLHMREWSSDFEGSHKLFAAAVIDCSKCYERMGLYTASGATMRVVRAIQLLAETRAAESHTAAEQIRLPMFSAVAVTHYFEYPT